MEQEEPFFSIIVPSYDRPGQLALCLQSLARLDYPRHRFEVIVVDDGGQTPPEGVMAPFQDRLDVSLLTQKHLGPAAARNTGANSARGEFLAFTDDDCMATPNWLQTLAAGFAKGPNDALGGRTINALPDNPYSTASQLILDVVYGYYNADPRQARFFASNNFALPVSALRAIGGFDESFFTSEDRELCDRWLHYGYQMVYLPQALVYHAHALTFRTFWRQHFNYGRGAFRVHRVRLGRDSQGPRPEFGFYHYLLRCVLSQMRGRRGLWLGALLLMWQVANAAGYLRERLNRTA